jgi:putative membrane protein
MSIAASVVVGLVALIHIYIVVLQMFLWDKPAGLKAFRQTKEAAATSKVLACFGG